MPWLLENGKRFTIEQIKNKPAEISDAIHFCNQWL